MLSLSTCWNSHRLHEGEHIVIDAHNTGFEWIEISHGTRISLFPGLLKCCQSGEIRVSSVHNFCPSPVEVTIDDPDAFEFTSHRESDRERAIKLTKQTIETAVRFACDRVVLHLGTVPMKSITAELERIAYEGGAYSRKFTEIKLKLVEERRKHSAFYLDRAKKALDELLPHAEAHGVKLAIETRSHFEQVPDESEMLQLLDHYAGTPWLGAWHDFGHVQRQANLGLLSHPQYLAAIAPRLLGCHVHDVDWPARDHRIPFTGGDVDFDTLLPLLPTDIPLVWELSPTQKKLQIAEKVVEWRKRYPHHG